ncbi:MAG: hypothetical protein LBV77_05520 [Candidatus Adiutrix intracellularis]|jgi:uncharacterized membrane protein YheB (UPF0754 family)|nr:hypothetical protein [Candidatus Adiutrix intracellularis]
MAKELIVFLNFKFEVSRVSIKSLNEDNLVEVPRFIINWRDYLTALSTLAINCGSDTDPRYEEYLKYRPDETLFQKLVTFQAELRALLSGVVRTGVLPDESWRRILNETNGLPMFVESLGGGELSPGRSGEVKFKYVDAAGDYNLHLLILVRSLILSGRLFDLAQDEEDCFYLREPRPEVAKRFVAEPGLVQTLTMDVAEKLPATLAIEAAEKLPGALEALIREKLPEALALKVEAEFPVALNRELEDRLPEYLNAAVEERIPEILAAKVETKLPIALAVNVETRLPYALASAVDERLPEALGREVAERLPRALAAEVKQKLPDALTKAVQTRLPEAMEQEIAARLPEAMGPALRDRFPIALSEKIEAEFPAALAERLAETLPELLEDRIAVELPVLLNARVAEKIPEALAAAVADRFSEALAREVSAKLPEALALQVEDRLPEALDRAVAERLPEALAEEMARKLPETLESEVRARLPELLNAALEAEKPGALAALEEDRAVIMAAAVETALPAALAEAVGSRLTEALDSEVARHLPEALEDTLLVEVAARLPEALARAVEERLPEALARAVEERLPEASAGELEVRSPEVLSLTVETAREIQSVATIAEGSGSAAKLGAPPPASSDSDPSFVAEAKEEDYENNKIVQLVTLISEDAHGDEAGVDGVLKNVMAPGQADTVAVTVANYDDDEPLLLTELISVVEPSRLDNNSDDDSDEPTMDLLLPVKLDSNLVCATPAAVVGPTSGGLENLNNEPGPQLELETDEPLVLRRSSSGKSTRLAPLECRLATFEQRHKRFPAGPK